MRKILSLLILLVILAFSQTEVYAAACRTGEDTDPAPTTVTNTGGCPANSCYKPKQEGGRTVYQCYNLPAAAGAGSTSAGTATGAATAAQCTSPTDANCTGGRGLQCNTAGGAIVQTGGDGIMTAIGCIPTEPRKLVEGLLKYGTFAAGGIAFLLMILGALQMITAEGNPESIKHAQERFYSAIIGLLLIIFAVLLMQVIGVDILGLPGFTR